MKKWQTKKIGELCDVIGGGTPKTNVKEYWSGDVVWVTPKDLGKLKTFKISDSEKKISTAGLKKSSTKLLPVGSVILSSRAPIGHLAIADAELTTNQGCRSFICRENNLFNKFLYYFLFSNREYLNSIGEGSTFKEVSGSKLKEVEIPIPSLLDQHRIVKILDKVFEKVAKAKENAEKNLQNAKELFESYLFDVFSIKNNNWEMKKLSDVCEKITDGTHQTPKYFDNGIIFLSSRNVTSGKINWNNIKFIDNKQHLEMHKRVAPRIGDILLAKNGTTGVAAMVDRDEVFDIYVSLALLRSKGDVAPDFLLYFINSPVAKKQFNKRLKGSGVPNLHLEEIREVVISFPKSLTEQKSIVTKLDALSAETKKLEAIYKQKIADLEELKKSVLKKAFAGEL